MCTQPGVDVGTSRVLLLAAFGSRRRQADSTAKMHSAQGRFAEIRRM